IRSVLPTLAGEGFLKPIGRRGFAVAAFSDAESMEALELRAVLEGQAARMLARNGAPADILAKLETCLAEGDALFDKGRLRPGDHERYGDMNTRVHTLIVRGVNSPTLSALISRVNRVPFAGPDVMAFDNVPPEQAYRMLLIAHGQHHSIVEAIKQRDGARADLLFREHAHGQRHSMFDRRVHV
ncbi:MAG: GntR family transcriptional regulator, partial [Rhodospirillaceae bacterium]